MKETNIMQDFIRYDDIELMLPDDVYIGLNKASREFDMSVNDLYYFIINGGKFHSQFFDEVFKEAFDNHFKYADKKDLISNTYVIPEIKRVYNAKDDSIITNYWNVNFDGSRVCHISDINIEDNNQTVIYSESIGDEWVEAIGYVHAKIEILDNLIGKLASSIRNVSNDAIKTEYKNIRDARIAFAISEDEARAKLLNEVVTPLIEGRDADKCTWNLNPVDKTLTIIETN